MLDAEEDGVLKNRALTRLLGGVNSFLVEAGPDRLQFRHSLMREVAYAGLPYRRRRELHERAATVLETTTFGRQPAPRAAGPALLPLCQVRRGVAVRAAPPAAMPPTAALPPQRRRRSNAQRRPPAIVELSRRSSEQPTSRLWATRSTWRVGPSTLPTPTAKPGRAVRDDPLRSAGRALKQARVAHRQGRYPLRFGASAPACEPSTVSRATRWQPSGPGCWLATPSGRVSQGRYPDARRCAEQAIAEAGEAGELDALAQAHLVLHTGGHVVGRAGAGRTARWRWSCSRSWATWAVSRTR